jgi:hypothetical protein
MCAISQKYKWGVSGSASEEAIATLAMNWGRQADMTKLDAGSARPNGKHGIREPRDGLVVAVYCHFGCFDIWSQFPVFA